MSLGLESNRQSYVHERNFGLLQQFFGALDSPLQQIFMRPHSERSPELRSKVHPTEPGNHGEILQRYFSGQMIIDIIENALETPFLQRPHVSAGEIL